MSRPPVRSKSNLSSNLGQEPVCPLCGVYLPSDHPLRTLLTPTLDHLLHNDVEAMRQFELMKRLTLEHPEVHDLRTLDCSWLTHSELLRLRELSDELARKLTGMFKERRQLGTFRIQAEPYLGFLMFRPALAQYRTPDAPEPRLKPLFDELKWIVIEGRLDEKGLWIPARDELTSDEARAIAEMRAATFYAKSDMIPGRIYMEGVEKLTFSTKEFMQWRQLSEIRR